MGKGKGRKRKAGAAPRRPGRHARALADPLVRRIVSDLIAAAITAVVGAVVKRARGRAKRG